MRWNQSQWFFTLNCKYLCVYVRAHTATYDLFLEYVQRLHPFHHFPSSLPPFPLCFHVFQWTEWLGEGEENETAPQLILSYSFSSTLIASRATIDIRTIYVSLLYLPSYFSPVIYRTSHLSRIICTEISVSPRPSFLSLISSLRRIFHSNLAPMRMVKCWDQTRKCKTV